MKKKSMFKKRRQTEEMALQITSMADIFTIILVFLLKSYATSAANLNPSKGMSLPEAHAAGTPVEALRVEVSSTGVLVEGKPVIALENYKFPAGDVQGNGTSALLSKALDIERQRQLVIAKANADVQVDPKIVVAADQRAPYNTLKTVLASASVNGYTDFKLAVVNGD